MMKNLLFILCLMMAGGSHGQEDVTITSKADIGKYFDKISSKIKSKESNKKEVASYFDLKIINELKLDSTIRRFKRSAESTFENTGKTFFEYNEFNMVVKSTLYSYDDELNVWHQNGRTEYTYNTSEKIIGEVASIFDRDDDLWEFDSKIETEYPSNNSEIETYSEWDKMTSAWVYQTKTEFVYTQSGEILSRHLYMWDIANSEWKKDYFDDYNYDENDNLIYAEICRLTINQDYEEEYINGRYNVTYDSNNNPLEIIGEIKRSSDSEWSIFTTENYVYVYDDKSRIVKETYNYNNPDYYGYSEMDTTINEYTYNERDSITMHMRSNTYYEDGEVTNAFTQKTENEYNEDGYLIERIFYSSLNNDSLTLESKTEHTIDNGNYLSTKKYNGWHVNDLLWINVETIDYKHDLNYEKEDAIYPHTHILRYSPFMSSVPIAFESKNLVLQVDKETNHWEGNSIMKSETKYFYSKLNSMNVGIEDQLQNTQIQNYPNPTTGLIQIKGLETRGEAFQLQISDTHGKVLLAERLPKQAAFQLQLNHWAKGIYLLKISNHQYIYHNKVVLMQ